MSKTQLTLDIEATLEMKSKTGRLMGCTEVTIGWYGNERVDYLTMDFKGVFRCYEIKVTKADFNSKACNTFCGHLNYYAMSVELYEQVKHDIPDHIGVFVYEPNSYWRGDWLKCVKRAKRQVVIPEEQEKLYQSLIRSLCRERDKFRRMAEWID